MSDPAPINGNGNGHKAKLFHLQGVALLMVLLTYCAIVLIALWKWNEAISAASVTGFMLFAQSYASKFFDWISGREQPKP